MALQKIDSEIVVIGGGAAGLAAAARLARAGRQVAVLEARERVGGRVWTRRMAGLDVPAELGAEFLHGAAKTTRALLRRAGMREQPAGRAQRYAKDGRLIAIDAFAEAQRAMQDASLEATRDMSFAEYLAKRRLLEKTATFARMMVEGFDAADPERASARAIAEEWGEGGALGDTQPRVRGGYGPLLEWLAAQVVRRGGPLRMQCVVREVRWRRGRVTLATEDARVEAEKAVVTLPLGVLQSGAVHIELPDAKREALRRLISGPVIKAALRFPTRFWERRAGDVAFFHSTRAPFPTFWTPLPARVPLLIAWAGGPKAERLEGKDVAEALRTSLDAIFRKAPEPDAIVVHDWAADPFARGAYSYMAVGGAGAREALAQPLDDTLFFAGEATSRDDSGTVSGALASGLRAADEVLQRSARRSSAVCSRR